MADPLRHDEPGSRSGERESRIEELLLAGLDHYFNGQHERAINVWTRVLFLDRSHPRARAYIERARGAVAERQREGEELLHTGVEAFQRGDADDARRVLTSAVDRGVAPDEAIALLDRLDRLATPPAPPSGPSLRRAGQPPQPAPAASQGRVSIMTLVLVLAIGLAAGAGVMIFIDASAAPAAVDASGTAPLRSGPALEPLPLPTAAEAAFTRARAFEQSGRLREAIDALETIRPWDPLRPQADELRGRLQTELLARAHAAAAPESGIR
jgi:hypothetical protein